MDFINNITDYFKSFSTHMDFVGQKRAERIFQVIIVVSGVIGFIWGFLAEQFSYTVYSLGIGFVLSSLIVLPPWPQFRRHNLAWQRVSGGNAEKNTSKTGGAADAVSPKKTKRKT